MSKIRLSVKTTIDKVGIGGIAVQNKLAPEN